MSIRIERVMTMLLLSATAYSADKAGGQSASNSSPRTGSAAPVSTLGSSWADAAKMPDMFSGMWMVKSGGMIESDEKRNVPYIEQAQKYVDA